MVSIIDIKYLKIIPSKTWATQNVDRIKLMITIKPKENSLEIIFVIEQNSYAQDLFEVR